MHPNESFLYRLVVMDDTIVTVGTKMATIKLWDVEDREVFANLRAVNVQDFIYTTHLYHPRTTSISHLPTAILKWLKLLNVEDGGMAFKTWQIS